MSIGYFISCLIKFFITLMIISYLIMPLGIGEGKWRYRLHCCVVFALVASIIGLVACIIISLWI